MEIAFNVDAVHAAAQAERQNSEKRAKPVFEKGWYLGWIEGAEKVPTADRTKIYKVLLSLTVHEQADRQGRVRSINAHLCFGHQDHIPRKLAYEGLADIGYATGAVVRKPDGSQAVNLDNARGMPLAVRLVKKPHKFTPTDGENAGQTIDMFINRVNGFGPLSMVPGMADPAPTGDGEAHPTATAVAPTPPPVPVQQMEGNPMGQEYTPPGPPAGYDPDEDIPF